MHTSKHNIVAAPPPHEKPTSLTPNLPRLDNLVSVETVPIQLPDGSVSPVRLFPAAERRHPSTQADRRRVIVIVPGLGIPAAFFDGFARALNRRGIDAAIGELRGHGDSRPRAGKDSTYGYHELVSVDFPAIFATVRERFPESTPFLLGHSLGGQLGALYAARIRGRLGGLIFVASGTPYFRTYGGLMAPGLLAVTQTVASVAKIAGFWSGKLDPMGFGPQSRVLMADWARLARTGRFEPSGADIDYEQRLTLLRLPVLSITMTGDDFAPRGSAKHLVDKLPNADVTYWTQPERLGHNGWIAHPETTVERIEKWLRDI